MANTPINPYGQQQGDQVTLGTGTRLCYVLAANDTAAEKKHYADAVCDGINDEVEIQQYIDLAIANKRALVLLAGTYYIDAATKTTQTSNDTYILADLSIASSPDSGGYSLILEGEDPYNRPVIRLSDAAYEAISSSKQMSLLSVTCSSTYGGGVDIKNLRIVTPWNQKKVVLMDFLKYGGYARIHSVSCTAYISGYNGQTVTISNPPAVAVEGCIGIRFIAKGPNGTYGSEITDCTISGAHEGVSLNTEWTVCNHVCSIFCVYGWTFGHYAGSSTSSSTHPIVLINCGDERNVNLPYFYSPNPAGQGGKQDIEFIGFSVERNANNTPGKVLGNLAREQVAGSARGVIRYTTGQGAGNNGTTGFWDHGYGKNTHTTDMAHERFGSTSQRVAYRPNYLQKYYDTDLNKEVTCIDTANKTWIDNAGNTVSNS